MRPPIDPALEIESTARLIRAIEALNALADLDDDSSDELDDDSSDEPIEHHFNEIREAVEQGANVNAVGGETNRTALMQAAEYGRLEMAKFLISKAADLNLIDRLGRTALTIAAECDHPELAEFLVTKGASLEINGFTVLMLAAANGNIGATKVLIDTIKIDPNVAHPEEGTALTMAVSHGHYKVARILIDRGADIDYINYLNPELLDDAAVVVSALYDRSYTLNLLIEKGANPFSSNLIRNLIYIREFLDRRIREIVPEEREFDGEQLTPEQRLEALASTLTTLALHPIRLISIENKEDGEVVIRILQAPNGIEDPERVYADIPEIIVPERFRTITFINDLIAQLTIVTDPSQDEARRRQSRSYLLDLIKETRVIQGDQQTLLTNGIRQALCVHLVKQDSLDIIFEALTLPHAPEAELAIAYAFLNIVFVQDLERALSSNFQNIVGIMLTRDIEDESLREKLALDHPDESKRPELSIADRGLKDKLGEDPLAIRALLMLAARNLGVAKMISEALNLGDADLIQAKARNALSPNWRDIISDEVNAILTDVAPIVDRAPAAPMVEGGGRAAIAQGEAIPDDIKELVLVIKRRVRDFKKRLDDTRKIAQRKSFVEESERRHATETVTGGLVSEVNHAADHTKLGTERPNHSFLSAEAIESEANAAELRREAEELEAKAAADTPMPAAAAEDEAAPAGELRLRGRRLPKEDTKKRAAGELGDETEAETDDEGAFPQSKRLRKASPSQPREVLPLRLRSPSAPRSDRDLDPYQDR